MDDVVFRIKVLLLLLHKLQSVHLFDVDIETSGRLFEDFARLRQVLLEQPRLVVHRLRHIVSDRVHDLSRHLS